jgi:NhaP-type Na+/H+ or K+/H+ antiporter
MYETEFAIFAAIVFVFALVSRRVERLNVTAPMAFIAAGMLLGASHVVSSLLNTEVLLLVGSIALVLVLFTDASRINISLFRVNAELPARLLIIGLPLTIAAGAVIAALLFTNLTIWQAGIIGAVLAPTDAGLGQAIVTSERVPVRIREALNVESGLNDGGSVPFLLVFLARGDSRRHRAPQLLDSRGGADRHWRGHRSYRRDCRRVADQKRHATGLDDQDV